MGVQQPSIFVTVWTRKGGAIGGVDYSLDDIEVGLLRNPPAPWTEDSRLHSCINCASVSCPDIPTAAFTVQNLSAEMDERMRLWLANTGKGLFVDPIASTATASMIFSWFQGDWTVNTTVIDWWISYAPANVSIWLR